MPAFFSRHFTFAPSWLLTEDFGARRRSTLVKKREGHLERTLGYLSPTLIGLRVTKASSWAEFKLREWVCTHNLEINNISKRRKEHQLTWAIVSKCKNWSVLFKISLLGNCKALLSQIWKKKRDHKTKCNSETPKWLTLMSFFSFAFLLLNYSPPLYPLPWSHTHKN